jgi:hypothetical protein
LQLRPVPPASENTRIGFLPYWKLLASATLADAPRGSTTVFIWPLSSSLRTTRCLRPDIQRNMPPGNLNETASAVLVGEDLETDDETA